MQLELSLEESPDRIDEPRHRKRLPDKGGDQLGPVGIDRQYVSRPEESYPGKSCLEDYSVRVSRRAKSVSLRVLPVLGLEVTIPHRFRRSDIPELIAENRDWILRQFVIVENETHPDFLVWPPEKLPLRAVDRTLILNYRSGHAHTDARRQAILEGEIEGDQLTISGYDKDRERLITLLAALLKAEARYVLAPILKQLAVEHGVAYKKMSIRGQRTLWGSYSSSGTLSLNYKLLFLPPDLARYVLLHELAHIRHLDHSAQFWLFLSGMDPRARALDEQLRTAGQYVPPWFEVAN